MANRVDQLECSRQKHVFVYFVTNGKVSFQIMRNNSDSDLQENVCPELLTGFR